MATAAAAKQLVVVHIRGEAAEHHAPEDGVKREGPDVRGGGVVLLAVGTGGIASGVLPVGSSHRCSLPDRGTDTAHHGRADHTVESEEDGQEDNNSAGVDIDCSVKGDIAGGDGGGPVVDALVVDNHPCERGEMNPEGFDTAMVDTENDGSHRTDPNGSSLERVNAGDCFPNLLRVHRILSVQTSSSNAVE